MMNDVPRLATITEECEIKQNGATRAIFYKGVPLFMTLARTLYGYDIFITEEYMGDPYVLYCKDEQDDYFVYKMWDSKEKAQEWLTNPK